MRHRSTRNWTISSTCPTISCLRNHWSNLHLQGLTFGTGSLALPSPICPHPAIGRHPVLPYCSNLGGGGPSINSSRLRMDGRVHLALSSRRRRLVVSIL